MYNGLFQIASQAMQSTDSARPGHGCALLALPRLDHTERRYTHCDAKQKRSIPDLTIR